MIDGIKSLFVKAILGGLAGLGICVWLLAEAPFFPGDMLVAGALICGLCGDR